jgi:hypothetical protein
VAGILAAKTLTELKAEYTGAMVGIAPHSIEGIAITAAKDQRKKELGA